MANSNERSAMMDNVFERVKTKYLIRQYCAENKVKEAQKEGLLAVYEITHRTGISLETLDSHLEQEKDNIQTAFSEIAALDISIRESRKADAAKAYKPNSPELNAALDALRTPLFALSPSVQIIQTLGEVPAFRKLVFSAYRGNLQEYLKKALEHQKN